jgi:hypothetical protein
VAGSRGGYGSAEIEFAEIDRHEWRTTMSSAERPEADVAEQAQDVVGHDDRPGDRPTADAEASIEDVLEQSTDAGLPDEDEAPRQG